MRSIDDVPGYGTLAAASDMAGQFVRSWRLAFQPPYPWWRDCVVEVSLAMRRCLLPLTLAMLAFVLGVAVSFVGGIIDLLGTQDRLPGAGTLGFIREPAMWVTVMIYAGVAGSAMTADLAARKLRQELDALSVLGVDNIRALVVPRIVAMAIGAPVLGLLSLLISEVAFFVLFPIYFGTNSAQFFESNSQFLLSVDVLAFIVRLELVGLFVGLVATYKGLSAGGGAEGVGRAVNQAVLIMFVGVWIINALANTAYLALFPEVTALRG
jgi:phospholipid/cholesterol/gamma-HCH transport system permease protein